MTLSNKIQKTGRFQLISPHGHNYYGRILSVLAAAFIAPATWNVTAQVNTGSDGHDGAFNPTANTVVNMASHPDGIYQYASVNIPKGVTVTFAPNAKNTPVTWLVQAGVLVNGVLDVSGQFVSSGANQARAGIGGPGGFSGGSGGSIPTSGQGPGGGAAQGNGYDIGGNGSYGSLGGQSSVYSGGVVSRQAPPGHIFGNQFLIPLLGGSGGGGGQGFGGGGGGGAIIIAASNIEINGGVKAEGGLSPWGGGNGSGGAIRLYASNISGSGMLDVAGGSGNSTWNMSGGAGRIRIDTYKNEFWGVITGLSSQGFQPIIIPSAGQLPQLTIASVAGVPVAESPTGEISTPDSVVSAQQPNPIPIVVQCSNLPLNTQITLSIKPMTGSAVSAVGYNSTGTQAYSTAIISINIPRGGGLIYATAATGK